MKKIYALLLCAMMLHGATSKAQCLWGRYFDEVFPTVNVSTVTYSTIYNLAMDIYQPAGDTLSARPLIILAHGGSFFYGSKTTDITVDSLCMRFARRGYVTVSIDYRLSNILAMTSSDSTLAIDEVVKAMGDGKAAVRYFMKDAATTNTYKIDTNHIYAGGNSAGAVLYMHVGYITDIIECPDYIDTALAHNGGFNGNSGNSGYNVKLDGIVNLAGALNMTSFVNSGDISSVNVQGDQDNTVNYTCGYPLGGSCHVKLCGLGALESEYTAKSIYHMSKVFYGDSHVPWTDTSAAARAKFNTVDSLVTIFLYSRVCTNPVSVSQYSENTEVSLFPNPAYGELNIHAMQAISEVTIYDQTGRVVVDHTGLSTSNHSINTAQLPRGVYLVRTRFTNDNLAPRVNRVTVE